MVLHDASGQIALPLEPHGRMQVVPPGVYRIVVNGPFARATSSTIEISPKAAVRFRFTGRDFAYARVDGFALSAGQPLFGATGVMWLRLVEGPSRTTSRVPYSILASTNADLVIERDGPPPPSMALEILAVGHSRVLLTLAPRYKASEGKTRALVFLRRVGTAITLSSRDVDRNCLGQAGASLRDAQLRQ